MGCRPARRDRGGTRCEVPHRGNTHNGLRSAAGPLSGDEGLFQAITGYFLLLLYIPEESS